MEDTADSGLWSLLEYRKLSISSFEYFFNKQFTEDFGAIKYVKYNNLKKNGLVHIMVANNMSTLAYTLTIVTSMNSFCVFQSQQLLF